MKRKTKSQQTAGGCLILIVLIIGVFGWIKDNVVDYTKSTFYIPVGFIAAIVIASAISRKSKRKHAAQKARQEYRDWGVDRAVYIALHQGWVSPHRLRTQVHLTEKQAMMFLELAEERGLLHQEINGRYYLTPAPETTLMPPSDS